MKCPVRVHDVQKLTGCLAALSRFISRLGEKALPLYRLMKKADKFEWTPEADAAFAELKALLSTQPVLAAPISKEPLLLYIAATGQVVSTVLTVEREEEGKAFKVQRPVYYLSEVLTPSKQRYPHYQKLVYGIYMTTRLLIISLIIPSQSSATLHYQRFCTIGMQLVEWPNGRLNFFPLISSLRQRKPLSPRQ